MDSEHWFYSDGENSIGPFKAERLRALYAAGVIADHTLVCQAEKMQWMQFVNATELGNDAHAATSEAPLRSPRLRSKLFIAAIIAGILIVVIIAGTRTFSPPHIQERIVTSEPPRDPLLLTLLKALEELSAACDQLLVAYPKGRSIDHDPLLDLMEADVSQQKRNTRKVIDEIESAATINNQELVTAISEFKFAASGYSGKQIKNATIKLMRAIENSADGAITQLPANVSDFIVD